MIPSVYSKMIMNESAFVENKRSISKHCFGRNFAVI